MRGPRFEEIVEYSANKKKLPADRELNISSLRFSHQIHYFLWQLVVLQKILSETL